MSKGLKPSTLDHAMRRNWTRPASDSDQPDVRFRSLADIGSANRNVRCYPSGHSRARVGIVTLVPLGAVTLSH